MQQPLGINGFGRIGKAIFILLIENETFRVSAINSPGLDINTIESYLKRDSVHKYNTTFSVKIIDNDNFSVNGRVIHVFRDKKAENLDWQTYHIDMVIDATGVYLTQEKLKAHRVKKMIMTAPAKDNTPLYVYGANHEMYHGEDIVSNASCTTNCITPLIAFLEKKYTIINSNFTTIHASTSSQQVVDTASSTSRTCRSIFNNIIPHTTGASSSIFKVVPSMKGKINGTSVRVPVNNVSLVDLNVELENPTTLTEILAEIDRSPYMQVCRENLVSSDYLTTKCPTIVDANACMELGRNNFKFMIWYDNEWSYSNQVIKMAETMVSVHAKASHIAAPCNSCSIDNITLKDKNVILRVDYNVPVDNGVITSDYRIETTIPTINKILASGCSRLVILSHMGRPTKKSDKHSLHVVLKALEKYITPSVGFLPDGLTETSLAILEKADHRVYLMENLRFHKEETAKAVDAGSEAYKVLQQLGNVYVNDAFGCLHRAHMSITGATCPDKAYGYLVEKELNALDVIVKNPEKKKTMAIIGGAKIHDKLELLRGLCEKVDTIYICGGNINAIIKETMSEYYNEISSKKAKIVLMEDGLLANSLSKDDAPRYATIDIVHDTGKFKGFNDISFMMGDGSFYDVGEKSLVTLKKLIDDHSIVFWNGTLGVVEDDRYIKGSASLTMFLCEFMQKSPDNRTIIGGGDTGGFVKNLGDKINQDIASLMTHVSTGGGASIEYITYNTLVGLEQFA